MSNYITWAYFLLLAPSLVTAIFCLGVVYTSFVSSKISPTSLQRSPDSLPGGGEGRGTRCPSPQEPHPRSRLKTDRNSVSVAVSAPKLTSNAVSVRFWLRLRFQHPISHSVFAATIRQRTETRVSEAYRRPTTLNGITYIALHREKNFELKP